MATYADTADIYCTDTDRTLEGEVIYFTPEKSLTVSLMRSIKLTLVYEPKIKVYVGNGQGLEFQSKGPKMSSSKDY